MVVLHPRTGTRKSILKPKEGQQGWGRGKDASPAVVLGSGRNVVDRVMDVYFSAMRVVSKRVGKNTKQLMDVERFDDMYNFI